MKYRIITFREMGKILKDNGYNFDRMSGDHAIYVKAGCNSVSINKRLNPLVARRLLKENHLQYE